MILPPDDKKESAHEGSTSTSLPQPSETLPRGTAHTSSGHSTSAVQHEPRNAGTSANFIVARPDEPTEETRLLPPPSYSEAVAQTGKAGKSRRWRYLAIGLFVVLFACDVVGVTVVQQKQRDSRHGWKRGGLDGKGTFDHRWQHRTPFLTNSPTLSNEFNPRECDLFSEPRLIDSWRNGATALPIYESTAEYLFSLNDYAAAAASLESLWVHVRGSKAYGAAHVLGPGTEIIEIERPPPGKLKIAIRITAENTTTLNDWHCCRAGGKGEEGIVLVGPNDGNRPVSSPWSVQGSRESRAGEDCIGCDDEWASSGYDGKIPPYLDLPLAEDSQALAADRILLETTNGNIAAQALNAQDRIVLHSENAFIACLQCTANSSFITVHNENGRVSGVYRAPNGSIDVVTSSQEVEGDFDSPRIWVKNDNANIKARFSGLLPEDENGSLLALTSFGRVIAAIDFANLPKKRRSSSGQGVVRGHKVPVRLGTQSSDIVATITNLPSYAAIAFEAEVIDGGITIVAPDQLHAILDLALPPSAVSTINLGDEKSREHKILRMDKQPSQDGRWHGPVHGDLRYRHWIPGRDSPEAMSSLRLESAQNVNLEL